MPAQTVVKAFNNLIKMLAIVLSLFAAHTAGQVNTATCNGAKYQYQGLAGYGYVATDAYDKESDNLGGIGSAIAIPRQTCKVTQSQLDCLLYALPDRGWNTQGTTNYQNRVHQFALHMDLTVNATLETPAGPNIRLSYLNSLLLTDPDGIPTTGLDPRGSKTFPGFPVLPLASFPGDGFGGSGAGGARIAIDSEGLVVNSDGTFWVSDEYGPYVYRFSLSGKLLQAIQPPDAFLPRRNGSISFSAASPPIYDDENVIVPEDPESGRDNNSGFEGLTASPDGRNLYVLAQRALLQDGGGKSATSRYARLLHYSISGRQTTYKAEYVVPLPIYGKNLRTAAQSELHYISPTQFLVLARDSDAGAGQDSTQSLYRHADIFDISKATDIKGPTYDCANCSVAPKGVLRQGVTAATYCTFLDYNDNSQLNRFGVHNGGAQDSRLLNEKWESFALVPLPRNGKDDNDYILFSVSDNDFITQNGYMKGGKYHYSDASGFNLDGQVLAFKVTLPSDVNSL